jgi:hypothetical protein
MPCGGRRHRDPGSHVDVPCRRCLPCEAFADGAAGIIREVWIFGQHFQLTFHLSELTQMKRHRAGVNG